MSVLAPDSKSPDSPAAPDFAELLVTQAPGLLPLVSAEQIHATQERFDIEAANADLRRQSAAVDRRFRGTYGMDPRGFGDTRRQLEAIDARMRPMPAGTGEIVLDTREVLAEDILTPAPRNQAAEARFRERIYGELTATPVRVEVLTKASPPLVVLRWGTTMLPHSQGRVTFADLVRKGAPFAQPYIDEVLNGPEMQEMREAIYTLRGEVSTITIEHKDLSDRNKEHNVVRRISEFLGRPGITDMLELMKEAEKHPENGTFEELLAKANAPYPSIRIWDQPLAFLEEAEKLIAKGELELATIGWMRARSHAMAAAERFSSYEQRVMKGAGIAIVWLERMKMAGKIAAGVATGGWSLAGQAAAAATYVFVQEGAQQKAEVSQGLRESVDFNALFKQSAMEGALSFLGGLTQGAFSKALATRFGASLATKFGPAVAERVISAGAAVTSSFYTTSADLVLQRIINGKEAMPSSVDELASRIVDDAVASGVMDATLGTALHVAQGGGHSPQGGEPPPQGELPPGHEPSEGAPPPPDDPSRPPDSDERTDHPRETSKPPAANETDLAGVAAAAHAAATGQGGGTGSGSGGRKPSLIEQLAIDAPLSPVAADRAIDHFGSWETAVHHLKKGTGDAAQLDIAARARILDALTARRRAVIAELDRFGAGPQGSASTEAGSDVDLNVKGDDAGLRTVQATAYLDQHHPGWQRRYRMGVMVDAGRTQVLAEALQGLPATMRKDISRRHSLAAEAVLVAREARTASTPEARAEILNRVPDPQLRARAEWLSSLDADGARAERQRLLVHSDRAMAAIDPKAKPEDRAQHISDALETQTLANALDPEAYVTSGGIRGVVLDKSLAPNEQYQLLVDQISMIQHLASEAGGMQNAMRRYETFKYIQRVVQHLASTNVAKGNATDLARLKYLDLRAELAYKVNREAAAASEAHTVSRGDLAAKSPQRLPTLEEELGHVPSKPGTARVYYEDFGPTPGVSDAFLAGDYQMFQQLVDSYLPMVRSRALGGELGGGPSPVRLPDLDPAAKAKTAAWINELAPVEGKMGTKERLEAEAVVQAHQAGKLEPKDGKPRRRVREHGEPDLDFLIEDKAGKVVGYVDIKTPVEPDLRSVDLQATNIAETIKGYDKTTQVVVDLKRLLKAKDKAAFRAALESELKTRGLDLSRVTLMNHY